MLKITLLLNIYLLALTLQGIILSLEKQAMDNDSKNGVYVPLGQGGP